MDNELPEHLGGHANVTHVDLGILQYFKDVGYESYLDIGCGPGGMIDAAVDLGYTSTGVDGDFIIERSNPHLVKLHDYTTGPLVLESTYDLVWSCEFVEHVEEEYVDNFMQTFKSGKTVCMTFAPPGATGYHHVNCQTKDYWIDVFSKYGFTFDQSLTKLLKSKSTMKKKFFRKNGLVFNKNV